MGADNSNANDLAMAGGGASMSPLSVLLVDDHELVRFGVKRMFEELGLGPITVHEAQSLNVAARIYKQHGDHIAVVVLDLNLPDTKGLSGLRTFKQRYPASRVVVLSGSVDDAIASEALAMGAEAFLHKASDTELLRKTLRAIVQNRFTRDDRPAIPAAMGSEPGAVAAIKRMSLSPRELAILDLLLQGCSNQEIAEATGLAIGTAKNYISGLLSVFGVTSRSRLIALFH